MLSARLGPKPLTCASRSFDAALELGRTRRGGRAVERRAVRLAHRGGAAHRTFRGELEDLLVPLAQLVQRLLDLGDDLAALDDDHLVADADVLALQLGGVV